MGGLPGVPRGDSAAWAVAVATGVVLLLAGLRVVSYVAARHSDAVLDGAFNVALGVWVALIGGHVVAKVGGQGGGS